MPTKEQIINNIREYSASDIVLAIRSGELTLYELSKNGVLTPLMKKRIEEQLTCVDDNESHDEVQESNAEPIEVDSFFNHDSVSKTEQEADVTPSIDDVTNAPVHISDTISSPVSVEKESTSFIKRLFSFKGRMRRMHYILCIIVSCALLCLSAFFMLELSKDSVSCGFLGAIIMFFSFWLIFAARVKRCHDRGNSGWWLLYTCIPYVGGVFDIIPLFGGGDKDENEYGPNPRN